MYFLLDDYVMNDSTRYLQPKVYDGMLQAYWPMHVSPKVVEGAYGVRLCGFTIALEAWRRGLEITVNSSNASSFQSYAISSSEKTLRFNRGRIVDLNKNSTVSTVINKNATRQLLLKAGVPTPLGETFTDNDPYDIALEFANKIGWPIVVKPLAGSLGRGVYTNIGGKEELLDCCQYLVDVLKIKSYIVEKHIHGDDYRVLANQDKVFAAAKRIPANVVGNGKDTIRQLIFAKNSLRKQNPNYFKGLIKIDKEVKYYIDKNGYSLGSVIPKGVLLFLRGKANTSAGGDLIDSTDEIPNDMAVASINAIKSIEGLEFGGVDLVYDDVTNEFAVIEINSRPQISHMYPTEGVGRDIPRMLIDTYFPEAPLKHDEINPYLVFDVNRILAPLESRVVDSLTIAPAMIFKKFSRRYYVLNSCSFKNKSQLSKKLSLLSRKLNVFGSILKRGDDVLEMRLAGERYSIEKFAVQVEALVRSENSRTAKWTGIVKQGFIVKID